MDSNNEKNTELKESITNAIENKTDPKNDERVNEENKDLKINEQIQSTIQDNLSEKHENEESNPSNNNNSEVSPVLEENKNQNSSENIPNIIQEKLSDSKINTEENNNAKENSDNQEDAQKQQENQQNLEENKENNETKDEQNIQQESADSTPEGTNANSKDENQDENNEKKDEEEPISSYIKDSLIKSTSQDGYTMKVDDSSNELAIKDTMDAALGQENNTDNENDNEAPQEPPNIEQSPEEGDYQNDSLFIAQVGQPYVYQKEQPKGPSDEELGRAVRSFQNFGSLPAQNETSAVSSYIGRQELESMISGDYKKAKEYDQLQKKLHSAVSQNKSNEIIKRREEHLQQQIDNAENQLKVLTKKWEDKIKEVSQSEQEKLDALGAEQNRKLEQFDRKYEDVNALREYSKPSIQLLNLRHQERVLLLANDFKGAQRANKQAEELEEKEAERAQTTAEADINMKRDNLAKTLQKQVDIRSVKAIDRINQMKYQKEKEEAALTLHIDNLKRSLSSLRSSTNIAARIQAQSAMAPVIPHMSPRTQKKINAFKNDSPAKRLQVKPNIISQPIPAKKRKQNLKALPSFTI